MKSNSPLVSVIIPAFNAQKTLRSSVESIMNQTYRNLEIIIIDDASKDGTWELMKQLQKEDPRIETFHNKKNVGIAGTRNKGLEISSGKYIAWQDADDISLPSRITAQVSVLEKNSEIGIVGAWLEFFTHKGESTYRKYKEHDAHLRKTVFRYSPVAQPVAMIRRECFEKVGNYNLKYPPAEDLDMSFRIGTYYLFHNIQAVLLRYRVSDESATFKQLSKIEKSTLEIRLMNVRNTAYTFTFIDFIYNFFQLTLLFLIPAKIKIKLFSLIRNNRSLDA